MTDKRSSVDLTPAANVAANPDASTAKAAAGEAPAVQGTVGQGPAGQGSVLQGSVLQGSAVQGSVVPRPSASEGGPESGPGGSDQALIVGAAPDGSALAVLRKRSPDAPVEAGIVRPLKEGEPIHGEVLRLKPRAEAPELCDVEVTLPARTSPAPTLPARKGPPKVNSAKFRDGWERVFQGDKSRSALN